MLLTFLSMFISWPMLLLILAVAAVAGFIYATSGVTGLITFATDARVWIGVAIAAGVVLLYTQTQTIQKQQTTIATQQTNTTASKDTQAVVTADVAKKQKRAVESNAEQNAITAAPTGDAVNALMQEIAKEQAADAAQSTAAPSPTPAPAPQPTTTPPITTVQQ